MTFKNYVCVLCAQDFTRRYSANRHNRILHQERSKIVRTLEYIIGRVTGEYVSADPLVFRRTNSRRPTDAILGNFPFINVAHNRSDSHSSEYMQRKEYILNQNPYIESARTHPADQFGDQTSSKLEEIKSLCAKFVSPQFRDNVLRNIELDVIEHEGKESVLDKYLQPLRKVEAFYAMSSSIGSEKLVKEKPPLSLHRKLGDLPQVVRDKLGEIEQVMSSNSNNTPNYVFEEIERLANDYRITSDLNILNVALDFRKSRV